MTETPSAETLYDKGLMCWYAGDKASAFRWYEQAAEAGSPTAAATLSRLYARGDGVGADPAVALKWQTRAAENGDADEMIALGDRYRWGRGVPVDEDRAFRWYIAATHKRSAVAALRVSDVWSARAARSNRPRDFIAAFRWCRRAAEKGLVDAMDKLALLCYRGEGVDKDLARAREWFETAAAGGSETAKLCLESLDFTEPAPETGLRHLRRK